MTLIHPPTKRYRQGLGFLNSELLSTLNRGPLPRPALEMEENRCFPWMRGQHFFDFSEVFDSAARNPQ